MWAHLCPSPGIRCRPAWRTCFPAAISAPTHIPTCTSPRTPPPAWPPASGRPPPPHLPLNFPARPVPALHTADLPSRLHPPSLLSACSHVQSCRVFSVLSPAPTRKSSFSQSPPATLAQTLGIVFYLASLPGSLLQSHCPLPQAALPLTVGEAQAACWRGLCWEEVDDLSEGKREQCRWETAVMKCAPLLVNPGLPLNADYPICSPSVRASGV